MGITVSPLASTIRTGIACGPGREARLMATCLSSGILLPLNGIFHTMHPSHRIIGIPRVEEDEDDDAEIFS